MCNKVAHDAVQIHGANGHTDAYPVQRYFRDAKVTEVIEGSSEIQQALIAQAALQGAPDDF
jgi:alkylation response protein AidB-like acyl-CoA dehydrogenase